MAGGMVSAVKLARAERRAAAVNYRKRGLSYRDIAEAIRADPDYDYPTYCEGTAREDCKIALRQLAEDTRSSAIELRQLELERLNMAIVTLVPLVEMGSLEAIDRWIKVINVRIKLLGLNLDVDGLNKAFATLISFGYDIKQTDSGYELVDTQAVKAEE